MLIPHYWAEARLQNKSAGKQVTVRRWGWSDASQAEAQAVAEQRAQEALARILSGENLRRRETKDSYGTQEGVPIREEVVSRHGENVVTRNSYGSLCLNAPRVLFADIDAHWTGALGIKPLGWWVSSTRAHRRDPRLKRFAGIIRGDSGDPWRNLRDPWRSSW